jgi:hypothetical protein
VRIPFFRALTWRKFKMGQSFDFNYGLKVTLQIELKEIYLAGNASEKIRKIKEEQS